ncbi:MAG: hypothetical protein COZ80_03810 [Ignavibacteria bacterium CG_4_8_14_3_um_filter_37_9]|nr:MAG: hypothetical protein COW85_13555 [Ignavibacteria bacterium CG22_combo_CG10-13_8_21_14_all_37_15]PIS44488.1 MAG: hypothetical protein COT22_10125 [Ignavibacteria bacterium CG08_land_8_20_14_0_20_37_9]PIW99744.1 MAG: hypothetical protein COZ80_03810 [Ignavibacteria bacterium CG_4_8_14_3_um_filter_37_9]PJC58737.1 MAG: hypothetical protein CO025_08445 [Ignavibacteria bacterium CG_4_9_14_0_2_um_filter_37_13]
MPTILIKDGFKFFFYANEHLPKHIHVAKAENFAKIDLNKLRITENHFNNRELKQVLEITRENKEYFLRRWNEYFKGKESQF